MCSRKRNLPGQVLFCKNFWYATITALLFFTACTPHMTRAPFDPRKCLEDVPRHVKGLKVLSGPRSEQSIIRDMRRAVCNGHVLFEQMQARDKTLRPGRVVFRVVVEYTGEVCGVRVEETNIQADAFLNRVSGFIMSTDFVIWGADDSDSVFLYPIQFGR